MNNIIVCFTGIRSLILRNEIFTIQQQKFEEVN